MFYASLNKKNRMHFLALNVQAVWLTKSKTYSSWKGNTQNMVGEQDGGDGGGFDEYPNVISSPLSNT